MGTPDRDVERNGVHAVIVLLLIAGIGVARRGGDNRLVPNLYKIIGRTAGSLPDYNYSGAMKGAGFVWDEKKLEHFITNPDEIVPGNNMKPYSGIASADDPRKVIAFLLSVAAGGP